MSTRTEAKILSELATASSLDEQRKLVDELDAVRAERRAAVQADRDTDLANAIIRDVLTPVAVHSLHSVNTDWLRDEDTSGGDYDHAMTAEATLWLKDLDAEVRADAAELREQTRGMARRVAGRYGEQAEAAEAVFIETVKRLSGLDRQATRKTAKDGDTSYCRICGIEMQQMEYAWYALSASSPQRQTPSHGHIRARIEGRPGEYGPDGVLVPGTPGGEGGQYDAPAGTIWDAGANAIPITAGRKQANRKTALDSLSPEALSQEQAQVEDEYLGQRFKSPTSGVEGEAVGVKANPYGGNPTLTIAWDDGTTSDHGLASVLSGWPGKQATRKQASEWVFKPQRDALYGGYWYKEKGPAFVTIMGVREDGTHDDVISIRMESLDWSALRGSDYAKASSFEEAKAQGDSFLTRYREGTRKQAVDISQAWINGDAAECPFCGEWVRGGADCSSNHYEKWGNENPSLLSPGDQRYQATRKQAKVCSECGDAVAQTDGDWHHDSGTKHDHAAQPKEAANKGAGYSQMRDATRKQAWEDPRSDRELGFRDGQAGVWDDAYNGNTEYGEGFNAGADYQADYMAGGDRSRPSPRGEVTVGDGFVAFEDTDDFTDFFLSLGAKQANKAVRSATINGTEWQWVLTGQEWDYTSTAAQYFDGKWHYLPPTHHDSVEEFHRFVDSWIETSRQNGYTVATRKTAFTYEEQEFLEARSEPWRAAEITGRSGTRPGEFTADDERQVQAYMPSNYEAQLTPDGRIIVIGKDVAGWTLDGYVIPRLFSGSIGVTEVSPSTLQPLATRKRANAMWSEDWDKAVEAFRAGRQATRKLAAVGWTEESNGMFTFRAGPGSGYAGVVRQGSALEGDTRWSFDVLGPNGRRSMTGFATAEEAKLEAEVAMGFFDFHGARKTAGYPVPPSWWESHPWVHPDRGNLFGAITDPTVEGTFNEISRVFRETGGYDDSYDRETVFTYHAERLGVDYDRFYDLWMSADKFGAKESGRKTADSAVTFHEMYGEVTRAQLAAYRKHNVSPSDHDMLVNAFGNDGAAIVAEIKRQVANGGRFSAFDIRRGDDDGYGWNYQATRKRANEKPSVEQGEVHEPLGEQSGHAESSEVDYDKLSQVTDRYMFEWVAAKRAFEEGKVHEPKGEQSGHAESEVTDYDLAPVTTEPMWSEDWPEGERETTAVRKSAVKGIAIYPDKRVVDVEINDYKDGQAIVQGLIEPVGLKDGSTMYVNEEGLYLFDNDQFNSIATDVAGLGGRTDLLFSGLKGPVYIVGPLDNDGYDTDVTDTARRWVNRVAREATKTEKG